MMSVFLLKMSLFPFDDAKVRRFFVMAMNCHHFLPKNALLFDVNQSTVREHTRFVRENTATVSKRNFVVTQKGVESVGMDAASIDYILRKKNQQLEIITLNNE